MGETIRALRQDAGVMAARARDEKEFFGQGWSHYPTPFRHTAGGVDYYLSVWNTPNCPQVNWSLRDAGCGLDDCGDETSLLLALTPEESRGLAARLGLPLDGWLAEALGACARDVTPGAVARSGNVVDRETFNVLRSGGG
jgi:hypothetical protein